MKHFHRLSWMASLIVCPVISLAQPGLIFDGDTTWDAGKGVVIFQTSGRMPDTKEGFFWNVPGEVRRITISSNVTVVGGFRIGYREASNPLFINGRDRETSVIYGTDTEPWTTKNGVAEHDKWKYGSVNVLADAVVHVSNLTAKNPRGYNISGYANKAVIHVSDCNLVDTRDGDNNNSDGFIGSAGSSIRRSLISTADDAIKVYQDITIENVTIEQHRNGAPIQFGWGGESGTATANIRNLTIKGVDAEGLYNMAPFTWESGTRGTRVVNIDGLTVSIDGKIYLEQQDKWVRVGLFELKPEDCTLEFNATGAVLGGISDGLIRTRGRIEIDGRVVR